MTSAVFCSTIYKIKNVGQEAACVGFCVGGGLANGRIPFFGACSFVKVKEIEPCRLGTGVFSDYLRRSKYEKADRCLYDG